MAALAKTPRFFATPAAFEAWLVKHHQRAEELLVGFYKRDSGRPSITWPESVDQALCFGWIDGIRRRVDDESYTIRFTPRRPGSIWSQVNIKRVAELRKAGAMRPAGLAAFARRDETKSLRYSYEQRHRSAFDPEQEKLLRATPKAWAFWQAQPPWYRRTATFLVVSAKKPETRLARLRALIERLSEGRR